MGGLRGEEEKEAEKDSAAILLCPAESGKEGAAFGSAMVGS